MPKITPSQLSYLRSGLAHKGGRLPLFDTEGQRIKRRTIKACLQKGYSRPMYSVSAGEDWQFCRLTKEGRSLFDKNASKMS